MNGGKSGDCKIFSCWVNNMKICNTKKTKYCCELKDKFLNDPRIGISYSQILREYYIDIIESPLKYCFSFCPFCGIKLPSELRDEYLRILEEYGIDDPLDESREERIPEEFKSDKWWKKRKL